MNAMEQIFSFSERWNVPFNLEFHLSPHENICTIALINIYYLYNIAQRACDVMYEKSTFPLWRFAVNLLHKEYHF